MEPGAEHQQQLRSVRAAGAGTGGGSAGGPGGGVGPAGLVGARALRRGGPGWRGSWGERVPVPPLFQLRDFLLVYNRMTELCFRHCVSNLNYRLLTRREVRPRGCPGVARAHGPAGRPRLEPPFAALILPVPQETCLESCAGKLVHSNHRLMRAYVALMPSLVQRRASDYEASAAQASQISATEGPVAATTPALLGAGGPGTAPDSLAAPGPGGPSQGAPGAGT